MHHFSFLQPSFKSFQILLILFISAPLALLNAQISMGPVTSNSPLCEGQDLVLSAECSSGSRFIRAAGIGSNTGARGFDEVFTSGDLPGTIDRMTEATFNLLSPVQLRDNYDLLIITQGSVGALNGDWTSRIKPYLDLGGSVFFEDGNNVGDLAPAVIGSLESITLDDAYVLDPVPVLTDGYTNFLEHHHFRIDSWDAGILTPFISDTDGVKTYGVYGTFPSNGRVLIWGPALDFHACKTCPHPDDNLYRAAVAATDWLTSLQSVSSITWSGPGGFSATGSTVTIPGVSASNAGLYTATCADAASSATGSVNVNIIAPPTAEASSNSPVCEGESIQLDAVTDNGGRFTRAAGIGANIGNRGFDEVFSSGDLNGTIDRITAATFNLLSPEQLRDNYDLLIITQGTLGSLDADWDTRIKPYIDLGGSVYWEDAINLNDLSPALSGHPESITLDDAYLLDPIPVLTDGYTSFLEHHHFAIDTYDDGIFTPFIFDLTRTDIYGLHASFESGGRMIVWGPALDFHGCKTCAWPDNNLYLAALAVTDWVTAFNSASVSWTGPAGFTSTNPSPAIAGATSANAGEYTLTVTNSAGCSATSSVDVSLAPQPTAEAYSNSPVCEGETLQLDAVTDAGGRFTRAAGIGANIGNRGFDEVFSSGDLNGTIDRITASTFNFLSPAQLRDNYDLLIITQGTISSLNADWETRIKPYLDLGGSVFWEDAINLNDLAPALSGHPESITLDDAYLLDPIPVLTDGYTSFLEHHHFAIDTYDDGLFTPFIFDLTRTDIYGLHASFESGGRMIVWGPALDFHGCKTCAWPDNNLYLAALAVTDWITTFISTPVSWSGPDGFSSTNPSPLIPNASAANTGAYTISITNSAGCEASASVNVVVNPNPTADAGPDQSICPGSTALLDGSATGGTAPYSYAWSPAGDLDDASTEDPVASPPASATYSLSVTDANGCSGSDEMTVEVADSIAPSITCPDDIELSACEEIATWTIDASDNCGAVSVSCSETSGLSLMNGQNLTVSCTATDESGNTSDCHFDISRKAALALTLCGDTSYVALGYAPEASAIISVSAASGGAEGFSYAWNTGEGAASITVSPENTTTYTVSATDADGCTISADHVVVVIDVSCGSKSSSKKTIKSKSTSKSKSKSKSNKDKVVLCELKSKGKTKEHCVKVKSISKKLDHKSKTYSLGPCGSPSFENTDCGEPVDSSASTAKAIIDESVNLTEGFAFDAYPNPFHSTVNIEFMTMDADHVLLEVYNIAGQKMAVLFNGNAEAGKSYTLNFKPDGVASGIYFARMVTGEGKTYAKKLIFNR